MDNNRLLKTTKTIKPNKIKGYRTMTDSPRLLFGRSGGLQTYKITY